MRDWLRDDVVQLISLKLAPFVGPTMASHATRMHCDKVAPGESVLSPGAIEQLLAALSPGLRVFIGDAKTREAFFHVRCALDLPTSERGAG